MTEPVDTDAMTSLTALEMDLLRKDVVFWIEQSDIWKRLANDERDVTDRLRAVIENAPHGYTCAAINSTHVLLPDRPCDCWKVDAL